MTADTEAIERMLRGAGAGKPDAASGIGGNPLAGDLAGLADIGGAGEGGAGGLDGAGMNGGGAGMQKPERGSEEEMRFMQLAWQDPEFRKNFYAQNQEKLEAMGIPCDGTFPMEPEQAAGQRVEQGGKQGLTIVPEAGFVVKTRALETNEKVFINFCKSPKVKSFSKDADPNDPSVERVRIPLSLGPARNDLDKGGDACVVYDVVFNTEVMDQAINSSEFKEFLIGLGLGWVMEKSGGGLDVTTYNLVKLRGNYKGNFPAMQVVRAEALIEEVNAMDEGGGAQFSSPHHAWEHAAVNSHGPSAAMPATRAAAENSNYADSNTGLRKSGGVPTYKGVSELPVGINPTPSTLTPAPCTLHPAP